MTMMLINSKRIKILYNIELYTKYSFYAENNK